MIDSERSWRGGQNQTYLLAKGLLASGHKVFFVLPKNAKAYAKFSEAGTCFEYWNSAVFGLLNGIFLTLKVCKKYNIEILDCQSSRAHFIGLLTKIFKPNLKLIVHRRVDNIPSQNPFTKWKYLHAGVDQFIAISCAIADIIEKYGVIREKIEVVRSAVSAEKYLKINKTLERERLFNFLRLDKDTVLLGNASAFTLQKGHGMLLNALATLAKKPTKKWHCVLAGDGELFEEIRDLSKKLNLDSQVTFLGFIEAVPEFLTGLDILVMPSQNEGLGTVILDAIHAGACVCATSVGGIPEIIIHEKTGLLVKNKYDAQDFCDQMRRLIESEQLRENLVAQAKLYVLQNFSIEKMIEGNLLSYKKLLG